MQLRELMRQRAEEKAKKAEQLKKTLQQSKNKDQVMQFRPCEGLWYRHESYDCRDLVLAAPCHVEAEGRCYGAPEEGEGREAEG